MVSKKLIIGSSSSSILQKKSSGDRNSFSNNKPNTRFAKRIETSEVLTCTKQLLAINNAIADGGLKKKKQLHFAYDSVVRS